MSCAAPPHRLLRELGIPHRRAARAFAPRFGLTSSLDGVRKAVEAARSVRDAWSTAVDVGRAAYAFSATHPAWVVEGEVTGAYVEALAPHADALRRARALGAAPAVEWGPQLAWCYERAAQAARTVSAALGPRGEPIGLDDVLSAAGPAFGREAPDEPQHPAQHEHPA